LWLVQVRGWSHRSPLGITQCCPFQPGVVRCSESLAGQSEGGQGWLVPARRKPLPKHLASDAFLSSEATQAGVGRGVLRGSAVTRISRGLYLDSACEPSLRRVLAGYLKVLPHDQTAVDGISALQLWGVDVGSVRPYRYVTIAKHHSIHEDLRVRRAKQLPPCTKAVLLPLPALVAARLQIDLATLVVAGDWLVRDGRAELAEVQAALATAAGRDCRKARRAAELVRDRSESPRETRLRLLIVLSGLPEPECNVEVGDEHGFIARVDLYLRAWRVAAEYEGDHHRTDPETYAKDLRRCEQLAAFGVLPVRVAKEHLRRPREVVQRVYSALVSRGYDGPAPVFGPEWRAAFEPWL
jgi:hypothetical protein